MELFGFRFGTRELILHGLEVVDRLLLRRRECRRLFQDLA